MAKKKSKVYATSGAQDPTHGNPTGPREYFPPAPPVAPIPTGSPTQQDPTHPGAGGSPVPITSPATPAPTAPSPTTAPTGGVGSTTWLTELFGSWNVPQDIQNKLIEIFTTYGGDTEMSSREAFAYIRSTDWYKQTFVGIEGGVTSKVLNSATRESEYVAYVIAANNAAQKYFGRNATNAEIAEYLSKGYTESYVPNIYGSQSYATNTDFGTSNLVLGSFGEGELTAAQKLELGKTQFGIGTELGTKIQESIARAQKRLETMFGGQTGGLTESKVQKPKDIDLQA